MGHGDIHTADPERPYASDGLRKGIRGDVEFHIRAFEPGILQCCLMHDRGHGMGDGVTDDPV